MSAPADAPSSGSLWTIRRVLTWTAERFEQRGLDAPRLTAEILLAHALDSSRVRLYADFDRPLAVEELGRFRTLVQRRQEGTPTHYLTGSKEFYNRPFDVDPRVLVPRPETEQLVDAVLETIPADAALQLLDLCTGSGCIAVTLAAERPQCRVWATDLSPEACAVAAANAARNGVSDRVAILTGDLFEPLPPELTFHLVVANPPYIPSAEIPGLAPEVRAEPMLALDGGPDGLSVVRRLVVGARRRLASGGLLAMEIAEKGGAATRALLEDAGFQDARIARDLERRERFAFGRSPSGA